MTLEILHKANIEEIIEVPQEYVDDTQDIALLRVTCKKEKDNPTYLLIGQDESTQEYYLVIEDNDTSEDYYPSKYNTTLMKLYEALLTKITKQND